MLVDEGGSEATRRLGRRREGAGGEVSADWGVGRDCASARCGEAEYGLSAEELEELAAAGGEAGSRNGEPMVEWSRGLAFCR